MSNVSGGERSNEIGKLSNSTSKVPSGEVEEVKVINKMGVQEPERTFQELTIRTPFSENDHSFLGSCIIA